MIALQHELTKVKAEIQELKTANKDWKVCTAIRPCISCIPDKFFFVFFCFNFTFENRAELASLYEPSDR